MSKTPKQFKTGPKKLIGIPKLKNLDLLKRSLLGRHFVLQRTMNPTQTQNSPLWETWASRSQQVSRCRVSFAKGHTSAKIARN